MNTKEAIEFLGFIKKDSDYTFENSGGSVLEKVIALLKRGEKYEAMWEEFYQTYNEDIIKTEGIFEGIFIDMAMNKLEQKYFSKEELCS